MSRATNILFMLTYALSAVILTAVISQMGYLVSGTAGLTSLLIFALCTQAHAGLNRMRERRLSKHKISELTSFANGLSRDLDTAEDCLRELNCRVEEEKVSLKSSRKQEVLLLEQLAKKIAHQKISAIPAAVQSVASAPIIDAVIIEEEQPRSTQGEVHQLEHQAPPIPEEAIEVLVLDEETIVEPEEAQQELPEELVQDDVIDAVVVESEEVATPEPIIEAPQKSFAQLLDEHNAAQSEAENLATLEMPEEFNALLIAEQQVADTEHLRQEAVENGNEESITDIAAEAPLPVIDTDVPQEVNVTNNYTQKTTRPLSVFDQIARATAHQQAMDEREGLTGQSSITAPVFTAAPLQIEQPYIPAPSMQQDVPSLSEVAPEPMPIPDLAPAPMSADELLLEMIRSSLEEDRAELYLQPIVTLPQRRTRFYEGLTRLRGPEGQMIMPADYTRVAEPAGMMSTVDNLLLLRCVHVVRQLRERGDMTAVFCNMSAHSIMDSSFFDQFISFMEQNKDLSSQLIIELSQDTLARLGEPEQKNLMSLSMLGFRFSLDRVTSLKFDMPHLKAFGFGFIKVPAMLLLGRNDGHANADIHPSDLGELLGRYDIELIAEHIEDEGTVRHVQDFDVSCAQGYLFGHPRPVDMNAAA
ncbi:MAG: EAL domain-containing protein [Rhodobiaceae bacterium]|nr:EAL domain-containing protein [Rhodobiaceae bacterium]